jgi:ABC-type phosphate transport system substrate-binding protein
MNLFHRKSLSLALLLAVTVSLSAQNSEPLASAKDAAISPMKSDKPAQKVVVVTGNRFSYELVQKWIDEYNKVNPNVQIIIESRGSTDPLKFDILAEVYEPDQEIKKSREYINVGRYAVLPVATSRSSFAKIYSNKGLTNELINQIFFHDIFADKSKEKAISAPFTVYTRLQKAGVPIVFTKYFGYQQKDIKGVAIAGADAHLLKALLRDSTGVTYLPLPLIYDKETRKPIEGLTVLPVDLNGNGKVSDNEKFYDTIDKVTEQLESIDADDIKNIPLEYLHLSVDKQTVSPEAVDFLKWVNENGQADLHHFGYLKPEEKRFEKAKFNEFASKRGR